jgi:hypothetical protein
MLMYYLGISSVTFLHHQKIFARLLLGVIFMLRLAKTRSNPCYTFGAYWNLSCHFDRDKAWTDGWMDGWVGG